MTSKARQLSRVAGVPRLKLSIWKAAAAQFFIGKDPTREEQQNQHRQSKVALLRELTASDRKLSPGSSKQEHEELKVKLICLRDGVLQRRY